MELNNTKLLMQQKMDAKLFDAYAIRVGIGTEKALITSPGVDGDTYFDMASCGKVLVTSTLILKAVGEGKLALQDTLKCFFPEAPQDKADITVQQLLTHTSGMICQNNPPDEILLADHDTIAAYILKEPLQYAVGERYNYSSFGYMLLGYILEKVYGQRLDTIFEEKLRKPLGMTRSRFNIPEDTPNAVQCYQKKQRHTMIDDYNVSHTSDGVAGCGAQFFTVNDAAKEVEAILQKSPLLYPEELFALAEQDYTPQDTTGRGLGYWLLDERSAKGEQLFPAGSFGHIGTTGTTLFMNRELGLYVIIFMNLRKLISEEWDRDYWTYIDVHFANLRTEIHTAIRSDLLAQGLLK